MIELITFVGGPADGKKTERPRPGIGTMNVPTSNGGQFQHTLRRCHDEAGRPVHLLAPAGREIDPAYLESHKLRN